jgi:1,4-dihydroxy-2-naphthoyl-CoA hydrolase
VTSGTITAIATPLHLGSTVATYDIAITDEQGRRVCTARLTCLLRKPTDS